MRDQATPPTNIVPIRQRPLPLEMRIRLWERLWSRLLAAPKNDPKKGEDSGSEKAT